MQCSHLETPQEKRWLWLCGRRPDPTVNLLNLERISGEWNIYLASFTVTWSGWESESASPVVLDSTLFGWLWPGWLRVLTNRKCRVLLHERRRQKKRHLHCSRAFFFSASSGAACEDRELCAGFQCSEKIRHLDEKLCGGFVDNLKKNKKIPTKKLAATGINYNTNGLNLITTKN